MVQWETIICSEHFSFYFAHHQHSSSAFSIVMKAKTENVYTYPAQSLAAWPCSWARGPPPPPSRTWAWPPCLPPRWHRSWIITSSYSSMLNIFFFSLSFFLSLSVALLHWLTLFLSLLLSDFFPGLDLNSFLGGVSGFSHLPCSLLSETLLWTVLPCTTVIIRCKLGWGDCVFSREFQEA